jgi:predicted transcriptional regulator of viral defense system
VVSHQSALVLHELTELLPGKVHLIVPPKFRKGAPNGCVLHKAVLAPGEVEEWEGFQVTTPLRTLLDVAAGGVSYEQLEKAVAVAIRRGSVWKRQLAEAVRKGAGLDRLRRAVEGQGGMAQTL